MKRELLSEIDPEMLLMPGYDDALVGWVSRCAQPPIAIYDYDTLVECVMRDGCTEEEAHEHIAFNIEGAWVGDYTPGILRLVK